MARVNFVTCSLNEYVALTPKDENSLYFLEDVARIYKGDHEVTKSLYVGNFPAASDAIPEKIYINPSTFELKIFDVGTSDWATILPGYVTTLADMKATGNEGKLAPVSVVKDYVSDALDAVANGSYVDASFDLTTGLMKFFGADDSVNPAKSVLLEGVAHGITWDVSNMKLTIPRYGLTDLEITFPEDSLLTDARYEQSYTFEDLHVGPALVFVVTNNGTSKDIAVPAENLVKDFTVGTTKTIKLSVDGSREITADIQIDRTNKTGKILLFNADDKIAESDITINTDDSADMGTSNTAVPTEKLVAAAIAKAVATVSADNILGDGNADEIVISTAKGITRSGKTIGGNSLDATPSNTVVATEAAVLDAISWKSVNG